MKRKFKIILLLTMISLTGIIMFQVYWSINAYRVNKKKFDGDIDIAMQRAMDDCKKDYFDSIRVVITKRLAPSETFMKIDTLYERDKSDVWLNINFSNLYTRVNQSFMISERQLDFYRRKIGHRAGLAETLAEASFYNPDLMNDFILLFGLYDISAHGIRYKLIQENYNRNANIHHVPHDTITNRDTLAYLNSKLPNTIYELPTNFAQADRLKLRHYLRTELYHRNVLAPFYLGFSSSHIRPVGFNSHYSETREYTYKYHGFKVFGVVGPEFYARAVFRKPQYTILKKMGITLFLSVVLIASSIYGFNYLIKTLLQQKKLAELKDDFINNMTHELKTPIATMTVAIEGLQKFNALNDPEKTQRYLETSRNELVRLNELVTKVLNVAAFENNEINLVKETIDIDELVEDVVSSEKLKTAKEINITYTNKDGIKSIHADRLHFRNVLANMVDNAIKYSDEPVNVNIVCSRSLNDIVFTVKDNGRGIPPSHIGMVFDKFHRVPVGNVHDVKGTGLGLSYVKYIVEAHGGKVSVKSEINAGSEFTFSIPL